MDEGTNYGKLNSVVNYVTVFWNFALQVHLGFQLQNYFGYYSVKILTECEYFHVHCPFIIIDHDVYLYNSYLKHSCCVLTYCMIIRIIF